MDDLPVALDASWNAFEHTLRAYGVKEKEIQKIIELNEEMGIYRGVECILNTVLNKEAM